MLPCSQLRRLAAAVLLWLCGCATLPAWADPLVATRNGSLPPLPGGAQATQLLTLADHPLALTADGAWLLADDPQHWQRATWQPGGAVLRGFSDKAQAFVLLAPQAVDGPQRVLRLALTGGQPLASPLPVLPLAVAKPWLAVLDGVLCVAGSDAQGALVLQALALDDPAARWKLLPGTGPSGLNVTSLAAQKGGLYLTAKGADGQDKLLQWTAAAGWAEKAAPGGSVLAGSATAMGQAHIAYLVQGAEQGSAPQWRMFHTITGAWAMLGQPPAAGARLGTPWRNGTLWELPGAQGGSAFVNAQVQPTQFLLSWVDWLIIVVYLVSMLGMGLYFYLREKRASTADFFVGGRSIPFWAAGVSLYAANTSSISYIAIPAKAFETNWQYLGNNLIAVLGLMFVAVYIVPLLRRLNLMSVFHYLESRFHPMIRTLASALFMAVQIGSRMSVILFLPSLAIATITGLDVSWSILIMGVFTIAYTALGGMKAVIWTDFVQLIVKMGGIFFAIGFVIYMLDGGTAQLMQVAQAEHKTRLLDFSFDLTKATVWGFVFLVVFDVVLTFPKDQVLMQRVLSTKDDRDAGRSIWTFAAIMIPAGVLFYGVGTALYVYYQSHPERMNPLLTIDATFPLFIAAELPVGVRGLIIAGILAAAMATLSSIMNSVATLASVDFYEKWVKNPDPKTSVRFAEAMTVVTGLLGMGVALLLSRFDIHSLFDVSIELAGLLGGGFAGAYTLGMFTRRANWQGVAIGVAVSITLTTLAWWMKLVHPYFYLGISICLCIIIGYLASWLFPAPSDESLEGLTIRKRG
jgi:SSS family transporter